MKRTIYVIGHGGSYANWMEGVLVSTMEQASLVVLTGGADVSTHLYGDKAHPTTYSDLERDVYEVAEFKKARALGKPIVGICRGSQLLCAMAGGKLVQNQPDPRGHHATTTYDEKVIWVTSSHHQAAHPWNLPADQFKVLAWTKGNSRYHQGYRDVEMVNGVAPGDIEIESCFYPAINALGYQGHPEWDFAAAIDGAARSVESIAWHRAHLTKLIEGTLSSHLGLDTAPSALHPLTA